MSVTLPVTFRAAPLDPSFSGTPQEFLDAIVERLSIQSDTQFSIFTIGSVVPNTNIGPFLKDGTTWWVWSSSAGAYIPEILDSKSLRYIVADTASPPSQTDYTFWIKTVAGKAVGIFYYSGGAWKDVYEDAFTAFATVTQLNTAVTNVTAAYQAAIAAQAVIDSDARNMSPFRARKSAAAQSYDAGDGDIVVVYDVEDFDAGGNYSGNEFTAPADGYYTIKASAYVSLSAGAPTAIDRQLKIRVNGVVVTRKNIQITDLTGGATMDVSDTQQLSLGDVVDIVVNITSTGASTWSILNDSTNTFFTGNRNLTE